MFIFSFIHLLLLFFWLHQNSVAVFRELCGVSAVSNLMQCILALSSRVAGPEGAPLLLFELRDHYPTLEPQGPLPDVLRQVVSTYEMVRRKETKQHFRAHVGWRCITMASKGRKESTKEKQNPNHCSTSRVLCTWPNNENPTPREKLVLKHKESSYCYVADNLPVCMAPTRLINAAVTSSPWPSFATSFQTNKLQAFIGQGEALCNCS